MDQIRILVIGAPGVLRDVVVDVIQNSADLRIVGVAADPGAVPEPFGAAADVVCDLGAEAGGSLLAPYELIKVVSVRDDGRRAQLWELRIHRTELGELSPLRLIETIRRRSPGAPPSSERSST
ncbi:hypothetical protein [Actinoplanes sp. NPDC051411]|uniref:hypothetical protein n=1 Tax=Actinoplanes sp. NPDC051411 TaxID=3155522 RepID=UPI00341B39DE